MFHMQNDPESGCVLILTGALCAIIIISSSSSSSSNPDDAHHDQASAYAPQVGHHALRQQSGQLTVLTCNTRRQTKLILAASHTTWARVKAKSVAVNTLQVLQQQSCMPAALSVGK